MDTEQRQIEEGYMTTPDVAAYLKCSPNTIRAYVAANTIPFHKVGRLVRFKRDEIDAWVSAQRSSEAAS